MTRSLAPRGRSGGRSPANTENRLVHKRPSHPEPRSWTRANSVPAGVGSYESHRVSVGNALGGYRNGHVDEASSATPTWHLPFSGGERGGSASSSAPVSKPMSSGFPSPVTPAKQAPCSDKLQLVLPDRDDENFEEFVEGGVELSPKKADSSEERTMLCTQPLSALDTPAALSRFWEPGRDLPKALFLDYDGTLREFEARPELAVPSPELMELLQALNDRADCVSHIISGRDAKFLETHFGRLDRFTLIAEHGFQISTKPDNANAERRWELWEHYGGDVKHFRDHENWKAIMREEIARLVSAHPGSHLEEKQSSLVWHFREVRDEALGEAAAEKAVVDLEQLRTRQRIKDVKITRGHKVVEASYRNVRKGLVMRRLCEEKALFGEPYASVLAAGDDVSDETMFEAAPHDFLTIKVGQGKTLARFRAMAPGELRDFLGRIASMK